MSVFFGSSNSGDRRWTTRWMGRTPTPPRTRYLPEPEEAGPIYASEPMWKISLEDILAVMSRPSEEWSLVSLRPSVPTCGICFDDLLQESEALKIPGCSHTFCGECLRTYTSMKIQQQRYPIKCPTCTTVGGAIHSNVEQEMVDKLQLMSKDLKVLVQLQIAAHAVVMRCPRCSKSMHVDRRDYISNTVLTCPLPRCQYSWCRGCEQEIDTSSNNHVCRNKKLDRLMRRKGWKYCPGCRTPIQKETGCNHMTCQSPGCSV